MKIPVEPIQRCCENQQGRNRLCAEEELSQSPSRTQVGREHRYLFLADALNSFFDRNFPCVVFHLEERLHIILHILLYVYL